MRTTVRLPDDLMDRAKKLAAAERRTLTDIIEQGVRQVVDKHNPRQRFYPRVSIASGRVLLDTVKTSELLEMLDEDLPLIKRR